MLIIKLTIAVTRKTVKKTFILVTSHDIQLISIKLKHLVIDEDIKTIRKSVNIFFKNADVGLFKIFFLK